MSDASFLWEMHEENGIFSGRYMGRGQWAELRSNRCAYQGWV